MMFWYGHGMGAWGWFAMSVSMILFWALIITVAVLLFRTLGRGPDHTSTATSGSSSRSAEQLLAERFARGEIDEEEYRRRLAALQSPGPPLAKP